VALLSGETSSYTVGYRIALSSAFELNASVSRTKSTAGVAVFNTGAGTYTSSATNDSSTDWGISARYNINKNFDVFAGYEFAGGDLGLNTWYSGLGISF
jgi:predicted porin